VHGANRLASNSLLDGLVFGYRAAAAVKKELERVKASPRWASAREGQGLAPMGLGPRGSRVRLSKVEKLIKKGKNNFFHQKIIKDIKDTMWQKVGIIRNGQDLLEAEKFFRNLVKKIKLNYLSPADFEIANMALVSWLVTRAALTRQESRGAHYRTDFPRTDDRNWRRHLVSCGGNCF
jgi:L-aspartate oxidase